MEERASFGKMQPGQKPRGPPVLPGVERASDTKQPEGTKENQNRPDVVSIDFRSPASPSAASLSSAEHSCKCEVMLVTEAI